MNEFIDLTGLTFGSWIVLRQGEDKLNGDGKDKPKRKMRAWTCECHCGYCNKIIRVVTEKNLINNKSKGCGNKSRIENGHNNHKYNTYNLTKEFGIGYTSKNEEFYFDLEDFNKIKDYYWYLHKGRTETDNYIRAFKENKNGVNKFIFLHNLVMDNIDNTIDHIDGNPLDNRKEKLRTCTKIENSKNLKLYSNNSSGVKGVSWNKKTS